MRQLHRLRGVFEASLRRPVLATAIVAAAARLAFAIASFVLNPVYLISDETQYIDLASTVASGRSAESWYPGYGQSLYSSVRTFIAPLRLLFEVFGDTRISGQLWAVGWGVLTAVLTVVLARRILRPTWALAVGVVVALMPSQVLWSSVVLRESMVWSGLVLAAIGATSFARHDDRMALRGAAIAVAGLLLVGTLRDQTMLAASLALPIGVGIATIGRRAEKVLLALVIAVLVPWASGAGPAGYDLVAAEIPALAKTRAEMTIEAASGFGATTLPAPATSTTTGATSTTTAVTSSSTTAPTTTVPPVVVEPREDGAAVIRHADGGTEVVKPGSVLVVSDDQQVEAVADADPTTSATSQDADAYVFRAGDTLVPDGKGALHVVKEGQSAVRTPDGNIHVIDKGYAGFTDRHGTVYVFETGGKSDLRTIPTGAIAVLLRPFLWESTSSITLRLASVENLLWYVLYLLGAAGVVLGWRRWRSWIAYPLVVTAAILAVAFVTQGNLGTSFRHRAQILPFLAVLAGLGAQLLWDRRQRAAART